MKKTATLIFCLLYSIFIYAKSPLPSSVESLITEEPPSTEYIQNIIDENSIKSVVDNDKPLNTINEIPTASLHKQTNRTDNRHYYKTHNNLIQTISSKNHSIAKAAKMDIVTPTTGKWILVDIEKSKLYVMKNKKPAVIFHNISIGRNGPTYSKIRNDEKTPLGRYKVKWVNKYSRYKLFFGLNYPNILDTELGYQKNSIGYDTYNRLISISKRQKLPPQSTNLGGNIGIHGLGDASLKVHQKYNWTKGCDALTNKQILKLRKYIKIGTIVVIK